MTNRMRPYMKNDDFEPLPDWLTAPEVMAALKQITGQEHEPSQDALRRSFRLHKGVAGNGTAIADMKDEERKAFAECTVVGAALLDDGMTDETLAASVDCYRNPTNENLAPLLDAIEVLRIRNGLPTRADIKKMKEAMPEVVETDNSLTLALPPGLGKALTAVILAPMVKAVVETLAKIAHEAGEAGIAVAEMAEKVGDKFPDFVVKTGISSGIHCGYLTAANDDEKNPDHVTETEKLRTAIANGHIVTSSPAPEAYNRIRRLLDGPDTQGAN